MITVNVTFFNWQFVKFKRSYNSTPPVLISINHSAKAKGNSAPVHNGLTTWIEVKFNRTVNFLQEKAGSLPQLTIPLRLTRSPSWRGVKSFYPQDVGLKPVRDCVHLRKGSV